MNPQWGLNAASLPSCLLLGQAPGSAPFTTRLPAGLTARPYITFIMRSFPVFLKGLSSFRSLLPLLAPPFPDPSASPAAPLPYTGAVN